MKIQNNYNTPNFGMSLVITKKATPDLLNASMIKLEKIEKVGKEVADTYGVNLELIEGLTPRIRTHYADAYLPPFNFARPYNSILPYTTKWDGADLNNIKKGDIYQNCLDMGSLEAAQRAYENITESRTELDRAVAFVKAISESYARQNRTIPVKVAEQKQRETLANNLLMQYGSND